MDYKKRIKSKLETLKEKKLIEKLKEVLINKNTYNELSEFENLIDDYIIKYNNIHEEINNTKIFPDEEYFYNENNNTKLIEILITYS